MGSTSPTPVPSESQIHSPAPGGMADITTRKHDLNATDIANDSEEKPWGKYSSISNTRIRDKDSHIENVHNILAICFPIMTMQHIRESNFYFCPFVFIRQEDMGISA